MGWLRDLFAALVAAFAHEKAVTPSQELVSAPPQPVLPPEPVQVAAPPPAPPSAAPGTDVLLPWDMEAKLTHANFHNVRVLCDLEGLTYEEKETMTATVWGESAFYVHAICKNYKVLTDGTHVLASTDHGICQWNDHWHPEITPHDAEYDPEKAVRLMCRAWKRGESSRRQWIAYRSGRYAQFLGHTL